MDQHLPRFTSAEAYNAAYPDCPVPADTHERNALRAYHAAMTGVEDDVTGTGSSLTVEFLPGGAPGPGEPDRTGTVVASNWGRGPILVLAERVSLRAAWKAVTGRWPARLSEVNAALRTLSLPENH
ncbi:hypothetical protein [Amycolatopsis aidingensis]|uniref:hypothetical protein n=1 Tax=Amycolatopsis aidingensis TaxID=2842453 RepID=UPI001E4B9F79|nr:hypothetical protein [Amycolatopsis aidingensis]